MSELALFSGIQDCADMHAYGPGVRNIYILHYILRGSGTFIRNGKHFTVHTGESFVIRPFETVEYYPDRKEPWKYVWLDFREERFGALLEQIAYKEDNCIIAAVDSPLLCPLFDALREMTASLTRPHAAEGMAEALLGTYIDAFPSAVETAAHDMAAAAEGIIKRSFHKSDFCIETLCSTLGISRATLHRCFVKRYGISVGAYIAAYRISCAKKFLSHGNTVKATAFSCGFLDPLYFSKLFKATVGIAPSEFQKRFRHSDIAKEGTPVK